MKIAFICPDGLDVRGGVKRICEYAMRLGHRGHDVYVLTKDTIMPEWLKDYDSFKLAPIKDYRHFKTDVAIATGGRAARRLGRMTKVKVKVYSVVMLESMNKPTEKHGKKIDRDRFLSDPYGQNWLYYANSTWMRDIVEKDFNQKCELVLAPSHERMRPVASIKPKNRVWALGYGGTSDWKGGGRTAEAVGLAKKHISGLQMIHYSQRSIPKQRRIIAKHWSCPDQDFLPTIYSSADVFIHSSRFEGWANTCMEAISCGTPVVSYKTPGIEDIVINNKTGIVVDTFDPTHMARAMVRLLQDKPRYEAMKIRCIEHAATFCWDVTLSKLEQIFEARL